MTSVGRLFLSYLTVGYDILDGIASIVAGLLIVVFLVREGCEIMCEG